MKISIITITRNSEDTLSQTIESVVRQECVDLEYIIIDGKSTDGTVDIIRRYEQYLSKWISESDIGISDAFNKGIRLATGDIIGIVSSDDYLPSGALAQVAQVYQSNPAVDVIYGNAIYIEPYNHKSYIIKPDIGLKTIWRRQSLKHAATFVSRDAYKRFGLFDLQYRLAMDYELILRFYVQGAKFVYTDCSLAAFRAGGVSTHCPTKTVREVRDIQMRYGYSPLKAYAVFWIKCLKLMIREWIVRAGAMQLLNIYRYFSARFTANIENL